MKGHTPGPWIATKSLSGTTMIYAANNLRGRPIGGAYSEADAVLMAAGPELLAALEQCAESLAFARDRLGMCGEGDGADRKADADDIIGSLPALLAARAAISKATGGAA